MHQGMPLDGTTRPLHPCGAGTWFSVQKNEPSTIEAPISANHFATAAAAQLLPHRAALAGKAAIAKDADASEAFELLRRALPYEPKAKKKKKAQSSSLRPFVLVEARLDSNGEPRFVDLGNGLEHELQPEDQPYEHTAVLVRTVRAPAPPPARARHPPPRVRVRVRVRVSLLLLFGLCFE